jgi:hypothetical protein
VRNAVMIEPSPLWITSLTDHRDHAVTLECVDQAGADGQLYGVCGEVVVPAALISPPGRRCALCDAAVQSGGRRAYPSRLPWIARLLGRGAR